MNLKSQAKNLQKNSYSMTLFIKVQKQIILTTYYFYHLVICHCSVVSNSIQPYEV